MSQANDPNDHVVDGSSALKTAGKEVAKTAGKKVAKVGLAKLGLPVILVVIAGFVIFSMVAAALFIVILAGSSDETSTPDESGDFWDGEISEIGENEIPAKFIPIYKAAAKKYGVPWNLLAAHHRVETRFSTIKNMVSPVGAVGHMQFMARTWVGWGYPGDRLGDANIPNEVLTNPKMIKKYGGYGVDANADGKADPFDIEDAVFSAANYLAHNGAADGNIREAVFAYNHADWYVEEVMGYAEKYVKGYVPVDGGGGGKTGVKVADVGRKWIGKSKYIFGGGRNKSDIAAGRFDCSSFVHWAFAQVGVDLGPLASTSTETLKHLGKPVSPKKMKPGDVVFFDTYKTDGHVGIYIGDGKFIGAQSSTGVAIADMSKGYWKEKFNGRVKRI
ncbi:bifunctional lytic transglycosylase/C40 family peptidase [Bacillus subtilis]|nr:bifunctional lytic transglycosylase/C40 family peptidase [Bacillus subtilis]MDM5300082.1 bifunctional lytic transglycosylase/C40 family peptidase [Bacillus subtilis]MDM5322135.1 bifunctional lytic transglycosylase/C40 family peptidase [Bacillus subtilis]MEC0314102.1 bifunctional lytic transglycosylase/C40 family peptidase [Bacillus subtilis]MEC0363554.1 bifunctional lytic transglycosylase/C40 family peptidase [Bacillus subtilis]MED3600840.1 bifunctional lytic transglycosylase/C40 family pep